MGTGIKERLWQPKIVVGVTGIAAVHGGIATANRNNVLALIQIAEERHMTLSVLSLHEKDADRPSFLPGSVRFRGFDGRKGRFSRQLVKLARPGDLFCFDHVRLSLPVLPLAALGLLRTVIFAHGSEASTRVRASSRWCFRFADLCLTNSRFTLRRMQERLGRFKGVACPLGLSPEFGDRREEDGRSREALCLQAADGCERTIGARVLLLTARMHSGEREKGHRELINVMPELLRLHPDVQLVFPGPGDDRSFLEQLAREKDVASSVFFPGFVPNSVLRLLYERCYAYVMPSRQEGFGLVYLEAMRYAKPCLGSADDGAQEVIVHGETGLLVNDPRNRTELLNCLHILLSDAVLAEEMGKKGYQRLQEMFTSQHHQQRVKSFIEGIL